MNRESKTKIYETDDYAMFKTLDGNRAIKDHRVDKIVQSIMNVGYITSPILVNEKMEVIDGQGRLAALERLRRPVQYMVHEGISIEECRQMNIHQSNWTDYDYVQSYAIRGSEDYQRLQSLMDTFKNIPSAVIIASCGKHLGNTSAVGSKPIRKGTFKLSAKDAERARWELGYAEKFAQVAKNIGGNRRPFYMALVYAYRNLDSHGRNEMEAVVRKRMLDFPSLTQIKDYLRYFDSFYNEGKQKKKHLHLATQYAVDTEL